MNIISLVPYVNFTQLRKEKALPKPMFTKVPKKGGDMIVGKKEFHLFNKYINTIILKCLRSNSLPDTDILRNDKIKITDEVEDFMVNTCWKIMDIKDIKECCILKHSGVVGKGLTSEDCVYICRATLTFGRERVDIIKELLALYCLSRLSGKMVTNVGIILPCQDEIIKVNLEKWNSDKYFKHVVSKIEEVNIINPLDQLHYVSKIVPYLGYHVSKKGKISTSLCKDKHCQIFISSPRGGPIKVSEEDIKETKESKCIFYIHAPYVINLCNGEKDLKSMCDQLQYGVKLGAKGVVIHLGKGNKSEKNMYDNLVKSSEFATEECPILLETGAGPELFSDINKLCIFYNTLPEKTRNVMKLCLDTCHVFVAGFNPSTAIKIFKENKIPIGLIHFNGSAKPFGSGLDRHAPALKSMIPLKELIFVGEYAIENKIHMIIE